MCEAIYYKNYQFFNTSIGAGGEAKVNSAQGNHSKVLIEYMVEYLAILHDSMSLLKSTSNTPKHIWGMTWSNSTLYPVYTPHIPLRGFEMFSGLFFGGKI